MTSMPGKRISRIAYNSLNLPNAMLIPKEYDTAPDVAVSTLYRADGVKVGRSVTETASIWLSNFSSTAGRNTNYLDGFEYFSESYTSTGGGPDLSLSRAMEVEAYSEVGRRAAHSQPLQPGGAVPLFKLQHFPTAEGFFDYQKKQYVYQYKDHLGNTRLSFGKTSAGVLEILDRNDYYPFGMTLGSRAGTTAYHPPGSYENYKYNGKELQETGMYDYGARFYMPDIGSYLYVNGKSIQIFLFIIVLL